MTGIAHVFGLLDSIRDALLEGRYDQLNSHGNEVEAILTRLQPDVLQSDDLADLRKRLKRNAELTRAARDGFREAVQQMQDHARAHSEIRGYSADGTRQDIVVEPQRPARRA